jgi:DNA-binding MarR family transcriptional regulator
MMQLLERKSLISETADGMRFALTIKGRELHIALLAKSKAVEEQLLGDFSPAEVADMRDFLKRFIRKSDPGIPDFWGND